MNRPNPGPARGSWWGFCAAAGALSGALLAIALLGDLRDNAAAFLGLYGAAFAAFCAALWLGLRLSARRWLAVAVVAAGTLFRLVMVPCQPSLSDDLYRYVWDGRVQAAGINPFVYPPGAPELRSLRDPAIFPKINHADIPTIYPPAAQFLFVAARGPFSSPWGLKVLFALLELGTSLVLLRILRRRGSPPMWVLAHAWNPLCILELSHSGHMDALPLFLLVLALERNDARAHLSASAALAVSAAAKFFSLALLPLFARRWKPAWIVVPAIVGALYLPYLGAGRKLFEGLGEFASRWRFNDPIFRLIAGSFEASLGDHDRWNLPSWAPGQPPQSHLGHVARGLGGSPYSLTRVLARIERSPGEVQKRIAYGGQGRSTTKLAHALGQVVVFILLGLLMTVLLLRRVSTDTASLAVLAAVLALSAALQPWYVTWLVPLAALTRNLPALAWSGSVVLAYTVFLRTDGIWKVPVPGLVVECAIPIAVAVFLWWRKRRCGST